MGVERKVGEIFEYGGKKIEVKPSAGTCSDCIFDGDCTRNSNSITGNCESSMRNDGVDVVFVEVKGQTQKLNLCEILKNCPKGTELWSDDYGTVKFVNVGSEWDTPIEVELADGRIAHYTEEGWHDKRFPANCLLWPSKDCRDWSKFTAPWYKREKFDPKTLQPFDKVLVSVGGEWQCDLFSHMLSGDAFNKRCIGVGDMNVVIPYNDETKHLIGTKEEVPDYYRYWDKQ